jgi:hypothetical protein
MRTIAVLIAMGAVAGLAVSSPSWPALVSLFSAWAPAPAPVHVEQHGDSRDPRAVPMKAAKATGSAAATRVARAVPVAPRPSDRSWQLARDISRAFESGNAEERERALMEWLPALVKLDARAAVALLENVEPGVTRDELRSRVTRLSTAADPAGAIEWAASLEDPNERKSVATEMTSQLAASDPAAAIEVAQQFDIGHDDGTLEHLTQIWAEEHPEDALSFVQAQPPGPVRDRLLARIAVVKQARRHDGGA